jgi:hypothetical protein
MSNLALFLQGDVALPSHIRNTELDNITKSLMGAATYKRISIRGSAFRMVVNGKEVATNEDRAMNVIIVAAAPHTSRTFYSKTYTEGEVTRPDCMSSNGESPDAGVANPQSKFCASCPQNIAGSGVGNSRACRFSRRLAVVAENGLDNGDIYQLTLPAKSLFGTGEANKMPLEQYAKFMAGHGINITSVVTEMRFDINADTPKLTFRAVRPLTDEEYAIAKQLGASKDAQDAISNDASSLDTSAPAAAPAPVFAAAPAPVAAPVVAPEPVVEAAPAAEPVKRESKKPVAEVPTDIAAVMSEWDD